MSTIGAQAVAVVTGSFLSGAMASISLITVPVFLDTDTESAHLVKQWARMYHYGHQVMPTMSIATCLLYGYIVAKRRSAQKSWGVFALAGATTVIMVPFTWFVMTSTNHRLFGLHDLIATDAMAVSVGGVKELVTAWWWLHCTRTCFPFIGAIIGTIGTFWH